MEYKNEIIFCQNEKCSINKNHAKNIKKEKKTKTFRRLHAKNFRLNFLTQVKLPVTFKSK